MLKKILESPLDSKEIKPLKPKGNQSWIFIGRTDAEAEAPYFGHLMQRADSLEKTLLMGKIEGRRRGDDRGWAGWMASPTQWTWVWANSGRWWRTGKPGMLLFMGSQSWTQLSDWTTKNIYIYIHILFHIIFCNGLSQDFKYSSLCYTVGPCFLSMIYLL